MGAITFINNSCTAIETGFNVAGSLPIIAAKSGVLRASLGVIQMVAASAISLGATVYHAIENLRSHPDQAKLAKLRTITRYANHHVIHGALNIFRGMAEAACAISTLGILNLVIFLPHNLTQDPEFAPVKRYRNPHPQPVFV